LAGDLNFRLILSLYRYQLLKQVGTHLSSLGYGDLFWKIELLLIWIKSYFKRKMRWAGNFYALIKRAVRDICDRGVYNKSKLRKR